MYAGVQTRATRGGYSDYRHYVVIQRPPQGANLLRTTVENKNNGIFMTGGYGRRTRLDPLSEGDEEAVDISLTARFTNAMSQLGVEQWAAQVV
jgi:hypothetical protein